MKWRKEITSLELMKERLSLVKTMKFSRDTKFRLKKRDITEQQVRSALADIENLSLYAVLKGKEQGEHYELHFPQSKRKALKIRVKLLGSELHVIAVSNVPRLVKLTTVSPKTA